jgi:Family of unknown function (DUF6220)
MEGTTLARRVYLWSARIFLASVAVQVFLIGLYLFADADLNLHRFFAIVPTLLSVILLGTTFAARLPARSKRWTGALVLMTFIQGMLPGFKYAGLGIIGALHPVNAFLVFWIGLVVLRDAQQHAVEEPTATPAEVGP